MTKKAIDHFEAEHGGRWRGSIQVDTTEVELGVFYHTYDLLKLLETKHPEWDLWLIIGSDLVPMLKDWGSGAKLVEEGRFIVIPRMEPASQSVSDLCKVHQLRNWKVPCGTESFIQTNCSSTEARRRLSRDDFTVGRCVYPKAQPIHRPLNHSQTTCSMLLPRHVLEYIALHKLYLT
eukprot:GHVN01049790.1.p1 GENE.GHVN01049790.1~~GHVN01049790.1.p1  ORF type:complete len:205 (-),score=10.39 GHVN01049790.1:107-637(-)